MKSKTLAWTIGMTLCAALTMPVWLPAQEQQQQPLRKEHLRYKLVDLGTFGGPESYINPAFTFGSHNQINRGGTVVGGAATSIPTTPTSNGFVCGGLDGTVPFVNHAFQWKGDTATDLAALPGADNCSVATSINVNGEIVGRSENGLFDQVVGANQIRAVLWKHGEIRDLGTLGGNGSSAGGFNNRGQVVGFAFNAVRDPVSIIYFGLAGSPDGTQTRAFLWENGDMQDLNTLGGPDAVALFINERGQVAGFSYTNATPNPATGVPTTHPFLWTQEGGMKDLGSLGGTLGWVDSETGGLNNRGQFVGLSNLAGDQIAHPFLWDGERLIDLFADTIGGNPVLADTINDEGEIVGGGTFPNRPLDAYLWKNGVATDLGTVDADGCSWAHAINSRGQVVGQSFSCDGSVVHTFLWENGSMVDLNSLVPPNSNLQLVDTRSINDHGEIAGVGLPPGCTLPLGDTQCGHAFVLIPCDEDHSEIEICGATETSPAATQNTFAAANQSPKNVLAVGLTPREIAARLQARFGRNRSFGTWPRK